MPTTGSLYFHIPFCTKKCPYCHFYVIPNRLADQTLLKESLQREWQWRATLWQTLTICSIYLGGGTPALYTHLEELLAPIPRSSDCEITIEANPEEASLERFRAFRALGINRLSLGVQSLDDRSLQSLGRIHSAQKARQAIFAAAAAGFDNISIDLMYDLPGQTEESWRYTLEQLKDLPIQHLSLYNLTIEPHTPFYKRKVQIPQAALSLRLLHRALDTLETLGFQRYEISAFARSGHTSRHNLGYWTGRPFLGFGPSAFSHWEGERFRNLANLQRYARSLKEGKSPVDFQERLPFFAQMKELFAIRLRVLEGVEETLFQLPLDTLRAIDRLETEGLLIREKGRIRLTERGTLFYDTVASELI